MEVSSNPLPDLVTHVQRTLDHISAATERRRIETETASAPTKNANIYYPQATSTSPNLSHLPLHPNLSIPVTIRINPRNARSTIKKQAYPCMAFELSTAPALLQSIHYYFHTHFSENLAAGLYPIFGEVILFVAKDASKDPNIKEVRQRVPFPGALSNSGSDPKMYMERIIKEALGGRLSLVVAFVDWQSRAQQVAEQREYNMVMTSRPRRRQAPTRDLLPLTETQFRTGVLMPTAVELGDGDGDGDRMQSYRRQLRSRLRSLEVEYGIRYANANEQEVEVENAQRQIRIVGQIPTFSRFVGATAPPGVMETIEGVFGVAGRG